VRLVVAVGGNALLERGEIPEAEAQERHALGAVAALAPLSHDHELVVTHGNGPQVGLLAIESTRDPDLTHPFPLDVLGAQTQGMIGYFFLQAFENLLPGRAVVSLICQTVVDPGDPAFAEPTKFVGTVYPEGEARRLADRFGWVVRPDGPGWRRVVASPEPLEIVEVATVRRLLEDGAVVVCAGGGGIPVERGEDGGLRGVEAVIDKDLTAALLACTLDAERLATFAARIEQHMQFRRDQLAADMVPSPGHETDVDREIRELLTRAARTALSELRAAHERLSDGTFGRCVDCSRQLPTERLEALPWVPRCITCHRATATEPDG